MARAGIRAAQHCPAGQRAGQASPAILSLCLLNCRSRALHWVGECTNVCHHLTCTISQQVTPEALALQAKRLHQPASVVTTASAQTAILGTAENRSIGTQVGFIFAASSASYSRHSASHEVASAQHVWP